MQLGLKRYPENVHNVVFQSDAQLISSLVFLVVPGRVRQAYSFDGLREVLPGIKMIQDIISRTQNVLSSAVTAPPSLTARVRFSIIALQRRK